MDRTTPLIVSGLPGQMQFLQVPQTGPLTNPADAMAKFSGLAETEDSRGDLANHPDASAPPAFPVPLQDDDRADDEHVIGVGMLPWSALASGLGSLSSTEPGAGALPPGEIDAPPHAALPGEEPAAGGSDAVADGLPAGEEAGGEAQGSAAEHGGSTEPGSGADQPGVPETAGGKPPVESAGGTPAPGMSGSGGSGIGMFHTGSVIQSISSSSSSGAGAAFHWGIGATIGAGGVSAAGRGLDVLSNGGLVVSAAAGLKPEISATHVRLAEANEIIRLMEGTVTVAQESVTEMQGVIGRTIVYMGQRDANIYLMESGISNLRNFIEIAKTAISQGPADITALQGEIADAEESIEQLTASITSSQDAISHMRSVMDQSRAVMRSSLAGIASATAIIEEQLRIVAEAKQQIAAWTGIYSTPDAGAGADDARADDDGGAGAGVDVERSAMHGYAEVNKLPAPLFSLTEHSMVPTHFLSITDLTDTLQFRAIPEAGALIQAAGAMEKFAELERNPEDAPDPVHDQDAADDDGASGTAMLQSSGPPPAPGSLPPAGSGPPGPPPIEVHANPYAVLADEESEGEVIDGEDGSDIEAQSDGEEGADVDELGDVDDQSEVDEQGGVEEQGSSGNQPALDPGAGHPAAGDPAAGKPHPASDTGSLTKSSASSSPSGLGGSFHWIGSSSSGGGIHLGGGAFNLEMSGALVGGAAGSVLHFVTNLNNADGQQNAGNSPGDNSLPPAPPVTHAGTNPPPLPGPVVAVAQPQQGNEHGVDEHPVEPQAYPDWGDMPAQMIPAAQRLYDAIRNVQEMQEMIKDSEAGKLLAQNALDRERTGIEENLSAIHRVEVHIGNLQNYIDDARETIERGSPDKAALEENIAYTRGMMEEFRSGIPDRLHANELRRGQIEHWQAEIDTRNAEIDAVRVGIADQWAIWIQAMDDLQEWGGSSTNLDDDNGDIKPGDDDDGDTGAGTGSGSDGAALFFDAGQALVIVASPENAWPG